MGNGVQQNTLLAGALKNNVLVWNPLPKKGTLFPVGFGIPSWPFVNKWRWTLASPNSANENKPDSMGCKQAPYSDSRCKEIQFLNPVKILTELYKHKKAQLCTHIKFWSYVKTPFLKIFWLQVSIYLTHLWPLYPCFLTKWPTWWKQK